MGRRAITKKRKLKGGNGSRSRDRGSNSRGRSRSRDRGLNSRGRSRGRGHKDIPDSYISAAIHTYWMAYLKDLPKTRELHIVGPNYDSGKGIQGWIRWFRGIPHPDEVEKDLDSQKEFFIQKLKADKEEWPKVIKLAEEYQQKDVRELARIYKAKEKGPLSSSLSLGHGVPNPSKF
jgi:hypothetical protein